MRVIHTIPAWSLTFKYQVNALANIRIVLARPIYGGNIGSVCRAMANMGLSDLALAGAGAFDQVEARKMACWATAILESSRQVVTLSDALADCALVFGATARLGLYRQHTRSPREWASAILAAAQAGRVALLFGPEDDGLSNEELTQCHHLIRIPSSPEYPALNLAQAVMICAYELYTVSGAFEPLPEKSPLASSRMKERLFAMWEELLLEIGFMEPDKAQHMMLGLRRIFARGALSEDDVRILMGIARQTRWYSDQARATPPG
ncbi:MAG: RNA methyltransferase [Lentisphaerae bacterium]|nr:RNA methyltransferase [Lentisphaerota bacterium]